MTEIGSVRDPRRAMILKDRLGSRTPLTEKKERQQRGHNRSNWISCIAVILSFIFALFEFFEIRIMQVSNFERVLILFCLLLVSDRSSIQHQREGFSSAREL
jgi:hypothetical protein